MTFHALCVHCYSNDEKNSLIKQNFPAVFELKKKIDWLFMKKGMFCLGTSSCCRPLVLRTRRPSLKTKLYTVNKIGNQFKQRAYWQKWQTVRKLTHCQKNEKKVYPNARLEKSIEHISASIAPIKSTRVSLNF